MADTISITAAMAESAASSTAAVSAAGQRAVISRPSPPSRSHSSSVTNGTTGCSSRRIAPCTVASTRWARSRLAPPSASGSLASSRYQSQNSSQKKACSFWTPWANS